MYKRNNFLGSTILVRIWVLTVHTAFFPLVKTVLNVVDTLENSFNKIKVYLFKR